MRRYERASTLLTSNRPVEDWGKLLGDVAAVTAMLDRILHHGHVLKCGPRSCGQKRNGSRRSLSMNMWPDGFPGRKQIGRRLSLVGDAVPKPLGFTAFSARMAVLFWAAGAAPPFRPLGRRSGRIPALPYPPPR